MPHAPAHDEEAHPPLAVEHVHPHRRLDEAAVRALAEHVLRAEGCALRYLGVILADHATVRTLNRLHLDHDYETDVLSFPLAPDDESARAEGARAVDGEVYVDLDTAAERHAEFEETFETEALRYVAHGLLHLIGYDDADAAGRRRMRRLEDRYLKDVMRET